MPKKNGSNASNGVSYAFDIANNGNNLHIPLKKKIVNTAKTKNQKLLLQSINENIITVSYGHCGSGKTRLAVLEGLKLFFEKKVERLIFTRPCVEANNEHLGYIPGTINEKLEPFMTPIFDFLNEYIEQKYVEQLISARKIITLPLAFMRGTTFTNAYVLGDEFQNTVPSQIRMFLTRIGENCKVVITGDINQTDIDEKNGLVDACERLTDIKGLNFVKLNEVDICRHPIVAKIEEKYR